MTARLALASPPAADPLDRGVLRFITAGSVDDGKSTLIGRLLYDARGVLADQLAALARAGARRTLGTRADDAQIDLSLLTDGLEAEREQGITIDVAYRYFATARRKFIIADTPGHEQYTRNMVTGASTADAAVILIDATRVGAAGAAVQLLPQTRRHSALAHLLGLRHVVVAVNKMDAVADAQARFERIRDAYGALAAALGLAAFTAIPVSALRGDNVVRGSAAMAWFRGPTLLQTLEDIDLTHDADVAAAPLRLAVQMVDKAAPDATGGARRYLGRVGAGVLRAGQRVQVLPAGSRAQVTAVETFDGPLAAAAAGRSVAVRLDREVDVSRGDWIVADDGAPAPQLARLLQADLAWLDNEALAPQRKLWLRHGTRTVLARVRRVEAVLDLATGAWAASTDAPVRPNDIARVVLEAQQPLAFDPFEKVRSSGAAVLLDPATHHTVAAVLLRGAARD